MVTRHDLPPAQQAVQAAHAAIAYCTENPGQITRNCTLVILAARDEEHLRSLGMQIEFIDPDTPVSWFSEPDLDWELTAIAAAGPVTARRLSRLPLALRGGETNGRQQLLASGEGRRAGESA